MMRSSLLEPCAGRLHVFALETAKQGPALGKRGTGRIREGRRAGKGKRGESRGDGKLKEAVRECGGSAVRRNGPSETTRSGQDMQSAQI